MSRNRFQKGMHIKFHGREYVIQDRLRKGDLRLRDVELDELRSVDETELVDALFDKQLVFLGDAKVTDAQRRTADSLVDDLNMLEDSDPRKVEAKRRWAYIREIINSKTACLNAAILVPLIERVHREIKDPNAAPHWRTVFYRWFKSYLACGEDPRALVPNFKKRGSTRRRFAVGRKARKQKFSTKEFLLAEEVAEVVEDVINEEYLTPQRLSVQEVYDKLEMRIAEKNQLRDPGDKLPVPHRNSLYRIVSRLDTYEKDRARFGKRYADNRHKCNQQAPQPARPLEGDYFVLLKETFCHRPVYDGNIERVDFPVTSRRLRCLFLRR